MTRDTQDGSEGLAAGLADAGFQMGHSTVGGHPVLVARRSEFRWKWIASRLHTFVVAFALDELSAECADQLTGEAQEYAIKHKGGWPRGLQTGTMTISVFVCHGADEEAGRWFEREPKHRYAAMRFPVLANPVAGELSYFKGRWTRGYIYADYIVGIVREVLAPAVRGDS
jgi:hypothetical protein